MRRRLFGRTRRRRAIFALARSVDHYRHELGMESRFNSLHDAICSFLEIRRGANLADDVTQHVLSVIPFAEEATVDRFQPFAPFPISDYGQQGRYPVDPASYPKNIG